MSELSKREKDILNIIIEEFLKTSKPIGSIYLSKQISDFSSSTIRHDLLDLDKKNYLYTFGVNGRVPKEHVLLNYFQSNLANFEDIKNMNLEKMKEYVLKINTSFFILVDFKKEKIKNIFLNFIENNKILISVVSETNLIFSKIITVNCELTPLIILKLNEIVKQIFLQKELESLKNIVELAKKYKNKDFYYLLLEIFNQDLYKQIFSTFNKNYELINFSSLNSQFNLKIIQEGSFKNHLLIYYNAGNIKYGFIWK